MNKTDTISCRRCKGTGLFDIYVPISTAGGGHFRQEVCSCRPGMSALIEADEATTIDLGNNETASIGISANADGTFTALTLSQSQDFKTRAGAEKWLARRGYSPTGKRLAA